MEEVNKMLKKKRACKKGKWSQEYKVKVSVAPVKRKKKGSWGTSDKPKWIVIHEEKYKNGAEHFVRGTNYKIKKVGSKYYIMAKVQYPPKSK
jgi:hypothetical protein